VERVLRFSRMGRASPDPRAPVDVRAELEQLVAEFAPLADARGAHVVADLDAVPRVALQSDALRHIVLNLLDNAVKYGPRGQTVRVRLSHDERDVRLEVGDEGPGIPDADRERIFNPYQRGGTAAHTAGSGIGLSVVRDLVVLHGGRVWAEPTADGEHGARFVVTLPAIADPSDARPDVGAHAASPDPEPART
jgi:signal transduction histidine kinase